MNDLRFVIVLVYYQRPNMLRFALNSIKEQDYKNWTLVFIDDGSETPGIPIMQSILHPGGDNNITLYVPHDEEKYSVTSYNSWCNAYRIDDTKEDKVAQVGTRHPEFMNKGILGAPRCTDNDVVIILCDDDALCPGYLSKLNEFYKNNPHINYSYCHLAPYNPLEERPDPSQMGRPFWLNHTGHGHPYSWVDGSQSTFRRRAFTLDGIRYPSPAHRCLDAALHTQLFDKYGPIGFNGICGQFKGTFHDQLGQRNSGNELYPIDTDIT